MNTWLEAKRKHGGDLRAVIAARDDMRRRLEVQGDLEGTLSKLEKEVSDAERAAKKEAQVLRGLREKAARELAKAGRRADAIDIARSITSFVERDRALKELAQ